MTEYPAEFRRPDHSDYQGSIDPGLRRTSIPTPLAKQLKYFNSPQDSLSLTFSMTNDEYPQWYEWVRTNAWTWFLMDVVSRHSPVNIVSQHRVRFTSQLEYTKRGDNWLSITVQAEIVPSDSEDPNVPEPEYDWVIAGAPDDPSTDWVIAKTPDDPATDWLISHLYYW